jgi:hypothetical protein
MQFFIDHLPLHFIGSAFLAIAGWAAKSLADLSRNVQNLNVQIAVVIEKINSHETRIQKLEGGDNK